MKKKIISLFLCIFMLCGVLSGCGGAGSQDTFLSEILKTNMIDLTNFDEDTFEKFAASMEVSCKGDLDDGGFHVTDSFLDYDANYYFKTYGLTSNEGLILTSRIDGINITIEFQSEKELDTGLEQIKTHLTSKIGAKYNVEGNRYSMLYRSSEDFDIYYIFTISVGDNKTVNINMTINETLRADSQYYDVITAYEDFVNNKVGTYYIVKTVDSDTPYLFIISNGVNIYHYEDGSVIETGKAPVATNSLISSVELTSDYKIAVSGDIREWNGEAHNWIRTDTKYNVYTFQDNGVIVEDYFSNYHSLNTVVSLSIYDNTTTILEAYKNMFTWEGELSEVDTSMNYFGEYISYLKENFADEDVEGYHYNLVDLNADGIYELNVSYSSANSFVLAYYNNEIILNRIEHGGIDFKSKENKILVSGGNQGDYYNTLCHLENGEFVTDVAGEWYEVVLEDGSGIKFEYKVNGVVVTEEEYNQYFEIDYDEWSGFQDAYSLAEIISEIKYKTENQ